MQLLNTVNLANSLAVHSLNELAVYQNGTVSLYRKNTSDNSLVLLRSFTLAGVKSLALSDNGKNLCAQTSTHVYRLTQEGANPLEVVGKMAISDTNYFLVLLSTAVQIVRETTVNLTATLTAGDVVVCGPTSFIVYNLTRYLRGTYTGVSLTPTTPTGKTIRHVAHTGNDSFAIFYSDGTVERNGVTRSLRALSRHRDCGKHIVADDSTDEYAYMKEHPLTEPAYFRKYTPPSDGDVVFTMFNADGSLNPLLVNNGGATIEPNLVTLGNNQFLSMPSDPNMIPRLRNFIFEYEVYFVTMPAAVSGTSLQPIMYWGNWATPGQPVNFDIYYINTAPMRLGLSVSHDASPPQYLTHNMQLVIGQWYAFKWVRKDGILTLFINDVEIVSQDFPFDITYDSTQPVVFGRRRGNTTGNVYWYSRMQLRKFMMKIG